MTDFSCPLFCSTPVVKVQTTRSVVLTKTGYRTAVFNRCRPYPGLQGIILEGLGDLEISKIGEIGEIEEMNL